MLIYKDFYYIFNYYYGYYINLSAHSINLYISRGYIIMYVFLGTFCVNLSRRGYTFYFTGLKIHVLREYLETAICRYIVKWFLGNCKLKSVFLWALNKMGQCAQNGNRKSKIFWKSYEKPKLKIKSLPNKRRYAKLCLHC